MFKMKALLIATALTAVSGTAQSAITVYTSQASFLAAVSAPGVDTFENLDITALTPSPIVRTAGAYGYTAASTTFFFGAGTTADPWLSTLTATDSITFSFFTGGVSALGGLFFGSASDGAFKAGDVTLTATDNSGTTTQTITGATTSSFLGFVSTGPLLSASITSVQPTAGYLWPTVDNLTLATVPAATAVPEPATWGMMILGFCLAGGAMRRRSGRPVVAG